MTGMVALLAAVLFEGSQGGVALKMASETQVIDPGRSVFLRVELTTARGVTAELPDLRDCVKGFSLAEDFVEEPTVGSDGSTTQVANWRLVPEPCAETYKIRPFAVGEVVGGPVYFTSPGAREPVTGEMEVVVRKDLPPLSWKLVGQCAAALAGALLVGAAAWFGLKYVARRIKEHRMSPIERAWVELDRLIQKGLPRRGRYKDFYVELTMVVRRYIQRKYGIRAPHMTTEEFLRAANPSDALKVFLESADMVKFAGVEATPEMADGATTRAREYLNSEKREEAR